MEQQTGSKQEKEYVKAVYCHPAYLTYMQRFNIQKTKIMTSGPITSWEIDGETADTLADFIFLGSKIMAEYDCSHEIK